MDTAERKNNSYQVALRLLRYKSRTEKEMKQLLHKRNFSPHQIASTIQKLKDIQYVDDEKYACNKCQYLAEVKFFGPLQIRAKLHAKYLDDELVHRVLNDYFSQNDERNFLQKAISKKLRQNGKPKTLNEFKRLFDYVKRRGYHIELIWQELKELKNSIGEKK